MQSAEITISPDFQVGKIDPRIYGSFIEHISTAIYGGIYDPEHPSADEQGFRKDVIELVKELNVPIVRYPGGNFVSGFNWEDSVGKNRPKRLELAWFVTETNQVGMHEFDDWCKKVNTEMMYAVNLGTRGADDARRVVEYMNHPSGSTLSDERIANGKQEPFAVKTFCLGNEMDGDWQIGHKKPQAYAELALDSAKMMKWVDPSIELVACGSTGPTMPSYIDWEWAVLNECYDKIEYISLHQYYTNSSYQIDNYTTKDYLSCIHNLDDHINSVVALCDAIKGKKRSKKTINISFDEWNAVNKWNLTQNNTDPECWANVREAGVCTYNHEDALMVGQFLIVFLRHADRIKIACQAQLVNCIAPIIAPKDGEAYRQTIFYPYMHASKYGRGTSLKTLISSPKYNSREYDDVPYIDAVATIDDEGTITVFAVNRSEDDDFELKINLRSFGAMKEIEHIVLRSDDPKAANTKDNPNNVVPTTLPPGTIDGETATIRLPHLSWNVVRFMSC